MHTSSRRHGGRSGTLFCSIRDSHSVDVLRLLERGVNDVMRLACILTPSFAVLGGLAWLQRHRSCLATSSRSRSQEPPIPRGWTWAPTCYRTVGDPSIARSIRCCRPCDAWLRWLAPRRLDLHCRTVFEVSSLMLSLYSWSCWMDE